VPCIRRWVSGEGGGGGWVVGLTLSVDTADQVVSSAGQTNGHSGPDHATSQADIERNRIGPKLPY